MLKVIKDALADRNLAAVAKATGVSYNTLVAIRAGSNANPTYRILRVLADYLGVPQ